MRSCRYGSKERIQDPAAHKSRIWQRIQRGFVFTALGAMLAIEPAIGCGAQQGIDAATKRHPTIEHVISEDRNSKEAIKFLKEARNQASQDTKDIFERIPQNYSAARRLARQVGAPRNAVTYMNFAYAIAAIGESGTRELHNTLGMEYFMRYSRTTLQEVYNNLNSNSCDGPLLLAAFNKNDYNLHFILEGMALEPLAKHYRLIITEVDSEDGLYAKINGISTTHGQISVLILAGHGQPDSIQLGTNNEKGNIDLTDEEEIHALKGKFIECPTIVLAACSTGESEKAVGASISRALGAELFAPVKSMNKTVYHLDENGALTQVTYNVEGKRFAQGTDSTSSGNSCKK